MKKMLIGVAVLFFILSACVQNAQPTQQSLLPNNDGAPTNISIGLIPSQHAAIAALSATLNLPADQIKVISAQAVIWPDGCLGVPRMSIMCTQAAVNGFQIILEANGKQYEYHTNQDGTSVIQSILSSVSGDVEEMSISQLEANLGIDKSKISVVSDTAVEFPNSCMGVAMIDVACAQIVTPGRIVILEANTIQYEYHSNQDGSILQPATVALTWTRQGGIAGFCDNLTIFLSGEVYGKQCKPQSKEATGTFAKLLSASERDQFDAWINEFGLVELDASNPIGVSDRMIVKLSMFGNGNSMLTKPEEQKLYDWVQNLYQKLNS